VPQAEIEGPDEPRRRAILAASRPNLTPPLNIRSAHFSPIMMHAALVLPETAVGMIEASATRKASRRLVIASSIVSPSDMQPGRVPAALILGQRPYGEAVGHTGIMLASPG
jgi:hypothetical protein